jgi:chromosome segregation ATPase
VRNGNGVAEIDPTAERLETIEEAFDEAVGAQAETDERLQQLGNELARVVAELRELREVVRRLADERGGD